MAGKETTAAGKILRKATLTSLQSYLTILTAATAKM